MTYRDSDSDYYLSSFSTNMANEKSASDIVSHDPGMLKRSVLDAPVLSSHDLSSIPSVHDAERSEFHPNLCHALPVVQVIHYDDWPKNRSLANHPRSCIMGRSPQNSSQCQPLPEIYVTSIDVQIAH